MLARKKSTYLFIFLYFLAHSQSNKLYNSQQIIKPVFLRRSIIELAANKYSQIFL